MAAPPPPPPMAKKCLLNHRKIEPDLAVVVELLKIELPAAEVEPPNGELAAVVEAVEVLPPNIDP